MKHSRNKNVQDVVEYKVRKLAEMMKRNLGRCVLFTGAGISTSAGIPDFRGPKGVWTLKAKGKHAVSKVDASKANPTPTHMACKALLDCGIVSHVVSQNVDGIHRRSGMAEEQIR